MNLNDYFNKYFQTFQTHNCEQLLDLLTQLFESSEIHEYDFENAKEIMYKIYQKLNFQNIPDFKDSLECFYYIFKALEAKSRHDVTGTFICLNESFQSFMKIFKEQEGIWLLNSLKYMVKQLRISAFETIEKDSIIDDNIYLRKAITSIRNIVSLINPSKAASHISKKRGIVFCATELCHLNFKIWKYKDCDVIINDAEIFMENAGLPQSVFGKSDIVTLKYYGGRIALFENQFKRAERELDTAFKECYQKSFKNQRNILKFLLPVKILCGKFPSVELIQKYRLYEYVNLAKSIFEGNIALFKEQTRKFRKLWIKRSLFVIMETLELVLVRNLFKRVCKLIKKPIIEIEYFVKAFNISGKINYDMEEAECLLGNLILKGYIKGYISHEKKKIVLSQTEPFPKFEKINEK